MLPLILICILVGAYSLERLRQRIAATAFFTSYALFVAVQASQLHVILLSSCNQIPSLSIYYKHQAVNVLDAIKDRSAFFQDLRNVVDYSQILRLIHNITYQKTYDLNYLPPTNIGVLAQFANRLIIYTLIAILLYVVVRIAAGLLPRNVMRDRVRYAFLGIALAIFCFMFMTNLHKGFYDCSLFVGSISCVAALSETLPCSLTCVPGLRRVAFVVLSCAIALSSILSTYLNRQDFTSKIVAGYTGPSAIVFATQDGLGVKLRNLMQRHNVPDKAAVVVDDQTYGILREHPLTLPITYLLASGASLLGETTKRHGAKYGAFYCTYLDTLKGTADFKILERISILPSVIPTCLVSFAPA